MNKFCNIRMTRVR